MKRVVSAVVVAIWAKLLVLSALAQGLPAGSSGAITSLTPSGISGTLCAATSGAVEAYVGQDVLGRVNITPTGTSCPNAAFFIPLTKSQVHQYAGRTVQARLVGPTVNLGGGSALIPIWIGVSVWYAVIPGPNGTWVPGTGPGDKPGLIQGDFNGLFLTGAAWNPANVDLLMVDNPGISSTNPQVQQIVTWQQSHPDVRFGVPEGMLTVGPNSGCLATVSSEGVEVYSANEYAAYPYAHDEWSALNYFASHGGRIDVIGLDIPLTAGLTKCGFTPHQTVAAMLPFVQQILILYPNVKFAYEEGTGAFNSTDWIRKSLEFFAEFKAQTGKPISYADFDVGLATPTVGGVNGLPLEHLYTTGNTIGVLPRVAAAFTAAGIDFAVNIDFGWSAGQTQAQAIAEIYSLQMAALASGVQFGHLSVQPYSLNGNVNKVLYNMPNTSPSALMWLPDHLP